MTSTTLPSRRAIRAGLVAAVTVELVVARTVSFATGYDFWLVGAWTVPLSVVTFLGVAAVKSRPGSIERARTRRSLTRPLVLALLALIGALITGVLAFGPPANPALGGLCHGNSLTRYLHPETEVQPRVLSDSDAHPQRLCNQDAVQQVHLVFGFFPASLLLAIASGVGFARRRDAPQENEEQSRASS